MELIPETATPIFVAFSVQNEKKADMKIWKVQ